MAIYHASLKSFSRGKGESSVAAAAYRAGIDLVDTRMRVEHRYSKRKGVQSFHMLAPEGAPEWCLDARAFWDANENGETRANARLARELEVSLPNELDADARERLSLALGQELVDRFQAVVLVAIHAPSSEGDEVKPNASRVFEPVGLSREHWSSASPIRGIFKDAFKRAGLPYFNPHSFRKTLVRLAQTTCRDAEEFKAWSQNLGHSGVLTTFYSYGEVQLSRQSEIFKALQHPRNNVEGQNVDEFAAALWRAMRAQPA